tara:strand:- start:844 stop:2532 length:1689 start_codon:yes stop_codon:yes gene_type:complete
MQLKLLKIIFFLSFILYHSTTYSKATVSNNFNQKYLSNYFSGLLSYDNQQNDLALKFFESSKPLIKKHNSYLRKYIFSLVNDGQVEKAIRQNNYWKNKKNSNFFESKLLAVVNSMSKKNFAKSQNLIEELKFYDSDDAFEVIIYEILNGYNSLFLNKKIKRSERDLGNLSLITSAFQNCYLNSESTDSYFINLINSDSGDYSRYLYFYLNNIVEKKDYSYAKEISSTIESLSSSLLISQTKAWIDSSDFSKFEKYFSCKNEKDILSEFFFLISNLYSSDDYFEKSNFYLNISNYLNSKFYFNLSLLAENYYLVDNFKKVKEILKNFNEEDQIYYWYKNKKLAQIIGEQKDDEKALKFIEKEFKKYKKPPKKIIYDMANIYKRSKKYEKAINYYTKVISKLDKKSKEYADTLYKRGGAYERIKDHKNSDKDLLLSLEINPDEPYVLNYLAYSWLERNYKIEEAIDMLHIAHNQRKNDPYIIDSVGWGYFLTGDYINAEKYIRQAVKLMPDDPIVNDHYGDILWKLNRKIQARYFWESAYNLEDSDKELKKNIKKKLIKGMEKI